MIDTKGNAVIPIEYDSIDYGGGIVVIENNGKYGVIDYQNQVMLPMEYDLCRVANEGELIFVMKGNSWGFCTINWS